MRKELMIGLLVYGIILTLKQFILIPEFIMGASMGFVICFELIGILPELQYQKIKQIKKVIFRRNK